MDKHFCSYEISLKVKELGFDEECFGYFPNVENSDKNKIHTDFDFEYTRNSTLPGATSFSAPIYSQIMDWLFEKYRIDIYTVYLPHHKEFCSYVNILDKPKNSFFTKNNIDSNKTKEEAILKSIEILKNLELCQS
jgi:hypothetical protein